MLCTQTHHQNKPLHAQALTCPSTPPTLLQCTGTTPFLPLRQPHCFFPTSPPLLNTHACNTTQDYNYMQTQQLTNNSHAQPFASSIVSARSAVVLTLPPLSRPALFLSLRTSLASMLMLATSFTMQATFSVLCSRRWRSSVVLPVVVEGVVGERRWRVGAPATAAATAAVATANVPS